MKNITQLNQFAEKEIKNILVDQFKIDNMTSTNKEINVDNLTQSILKTIDWNDELLMHKGLIWITENYLKKNNLI